MLRIDGELSCVEMPHVFVVNVPRVVFLPALVAYAVAVAPLHTRPNLAVVALTGARADRRRRRRNVVGNDRLRLVVENQHFRSGWAPRRNSFYTTIHPPAAEQKTTPILFAAALIVPFAIAPDALVRIVIALALVLLAVALNS